MSTSGDNTGALRSYTAGQMLEEALRRAGVKQAQFTSEVVEIVFDNFNTMLDEFLNLGIQLWGRDSVILPLYQNINQVPLPLGTSLVISANQRTLQQPPGINPFSSAGGTAANAFDDNLGTACIATVTNGNIGTLYSTATQITTVGVLFYTGGNFALFYEYTVDGINWIAADAATIIATAGQWLWRDIAGTPAALGWRVRSVSTDIFSATEIYFGNQPSEIPMGVWSLDDWNAMPVKNTPGPPWNWYQDRQRDVPVLFVWPMPDITAAFMQLVVWRRRYLAQVTDMSQTLDISRRWNEAVTATMARRLCRSVPEADMNRYAMLSEEETKAMNLAIGEERDPAPVRFNPGLEVYTRL